ncbi:MAG: hypothetical protein K2P99_03135 [Burkholderiales bacterium]|nr:hypothetical protein [Burkholderiales bacterium]
MHRELNTIKIIREYLVKKELLIDEASNIDDIFNFFKQLSENIYMQHT